MKTNYETIGEFMEDWRCTHDWLPHHVFNRMKQGRQFMIEDGCLLMQDSDDSYRWMQVAQAKPNEKILGGTKMTTKENIQYQLDEQNKVHMKLEAQMRTHSDPLIPVGNFYQSDGIIRGLELALVQCNNDLPFTKDELRAILQMCLEQSASDKTAMSILSKVRVSLGLDKEVMK